MSQYTQTESLSRMITALAQYIDELAADRAVLSEAAAACEAVLGNDDLSKKYVSQLEALHQDVMAVQSAAEQMHNDLNGQLGKINWVYDG